MDIKAIFGFKPWHCFLVVWQSQALLEDNIELHAASHWRRTRKSVFEGLFIAEGFFFFFYDKVAVVGSILTSAFGSQEWHIRRMQHNWFWWNVDFYCCFAYFTRIERPYNASLYSGVKPLGALLLLRHHIALYARLFSGPTLLKHKTKNRRTEFTCEI